MPITYPNESDAYRVARNRLLAAELALRQKVADVAAERRALPDGGPVTGSYQFTDMDNAPHPMTALFGRHDTLAIYSLMYGDDDPCPMCCAMLDGLNGQAAHIEQSIALAVVARADPGPLKQLAATRSWTALSLYSTQDEYQRDYHAEAADGTQLPILNVFRRDGSVVTHFWGSEGFFADVDGHPRHVDQIWPVWNMLDLTPSGRGDWMPSL